MNRRTHFINVALISSWIRSLTILFFIVSRHMERFLKINSTEDSENVGRCVKVTSWKRRLFLKVRHRGFHTAPHAAVGHLVESRRFARLHPSATAQCLSEAFVGPPVWPFLRNGFRLLILTAYRFWRPWYLTHCRVYSSDRFCKFLFLSLLLPIFSPNQFTATTCLSLITVCKLAPGALQLYNSKMSSFKRTTRSSIPSYLFPF